MKVDFKIAIVIVLSAIILSSIFIYSEIENNVKKDSVYEEKETINILMINSYHEGNYWEERVLEGFEKRLSEFSNYNINLKIEYLDSTSRNISRYFENFKSLLESKYNDESIDVIYTVNYEAYNFIKELKNDKQSVFYQVPVVITGVDEEILTGESKEQFDSIGFYNVDDTIKLLRLILDLNKDVEKLNIIVENSSYGKTITDKILSYMDVMSDLSGRDIEVKIIKEDYIEDISYKLKDSNDNKKQVNILAGEFKYKNSNIFLEPKETIDNIKKINNYPIYSNDQRYLNAGILGGCIDIGQHHGEVAAELIIKSISSDMPNYTLEKQSISEVYVDYNSIYEYNIKTCDINSSMNIINKKFYQLLLPKEVKMYAYYAFIVLILVLIYYITREVKRMEIDKKIKEEEKIKKLKESLKNDFIVNLSHELRTPINLILNSSKTIKYNIDKKHISEGSINDIKNDIENKLDFIDNNSYRLLKISNNIIDTIRFESGLLKLYWRNENIVSVVEEVFTSSIEFAKKNNIEMIFDSLSEEIIIAIDKVQIQRVILNLISNAIKFIENDGIINVNIVNMEDEVLIEVVDNGIGISEENLEKIFDNFYQVDYSLTRINEGAGVGLSIVKDIVEIHSGRIEVESEEGKGSIFKVYIPIKIINDGCEEKIISMNYDIKTMTQIELSDLI